MSMINTFKSFVANVQVQVTDYLSSPNAGQNDGLQPTNKSVQTDWRAWFGFKSSDTSTPGFNANTALNFTAGKIQLTNDDIKNSRLRQAGQTVQTNRLPQDKSKDDYPPFELTIIVPENQETLSYEQLQNSVIRNVFDRNHVAYSRASLEEIAKKEKLDYSPGYDYATSKATYTPKDGLWPNQKPQTMVVNGKEQRVLRYVVSSDVQKQIMNDKALSEAIKASGKKTFAELNINERMTMAMQMAYDKHYLPHDVQEAIKDFDPKTLIAGMTVAGGVLYAASKAGASKAIPFVGAGVTMAQLTYYYGHADAFLNECARAKSPEDLDEAAKDFSILVKQGGVDLTITLATAGASKLGKVSEAGGKLVGLVEDGVKATRSKIGKLGDEIVAGMRSTFGDDLVYETNAASKPNAASLDPNLYSKAADELDMLKGGSAAGKDAITETAEQGLTDKAKASAKRLKSELTKDEIKAAKEQLVTLNVARTEMLARLDNLANDVNLSPAARADAQTAYNAIRDHLTQDDLAGALRDVHNQPVVKSGSGKVYDHLGEVENSALTPLRELKDKLTSDMRRQAMQQARTPNPDYSEYKRLAKEVDSISEMITKIEKFLEIGK